MTTDGGKIRDAFIGLASAYADHDTDAIHRAIVANGKLIVDPDPEVMRDNLADYLSLTGALAGALVEIASHLSNGVVSIEDVLTTMADHKMD